MLRITLSKACASLLVINYSACATISPSLKDEEGYYEIDSGTPQRNDDRAPSSVMCNGVSTKLTGQASYYSNRFAGRRTASGERYNPRELTAAHPSLPFGTAVRVLRLDNGAEVYVKINDRGPFGQSGRIIDLSRRAAQELGMISSGVAYVRLEIEPNSGLVCK